MLYQTAILPVVAIWCFNQKEKNVKYYCHWYKIVVLSLQNSKVLSTIVIDKVLFYQTAIVPVVAMWWFRQKEEEKCKILSSLIQKVEYYQLSLLIKSCFIRRQSCRWSQCDGSVKKKKKNVKYYPHWYKK